MEAVSTPPLRTDGGPWWKHRWPWLLMAGPAAVVVAGSYASYLAVTHQDAMVVGDYYKQGKAINQDLRRDRVATQLGLALGLRYDRAAGVLRGTLRSAAPGLPNAVLIKLAHPTLPSKDVQLLARVDRDGTFAVVLPQLERARWQVTAEDGGRTWRLEAGWSWPDQGAVNIQADAPAPQ